MELTDNMDNRFRPQRQISHHILWPPKTILRLFCPSTEGHPQNELRVWSPSGPLNPRSDYEAKSRFCTPTNHGLRISSRIAGVHELGTAEPYVSQLLFAPSGTFELQVQEELHHVKSSSLCRPAAI